MLHRMDHTSSSTILRCELCGKPFNKPSTLKRHGYYCRSLKSKERPIRSRSCVACAKAKARCDNKSPACTRCITKGIACLSQPRPVAARKEGSQPSATKNLPKDTALDANPRRSLAIDVHTYESADTLGEVNLPNVAEQRLDWDLVTVDNNNNTQIDLAVPEPLQPDFLELFNPLQPKQGYVPGELMSFQRPSIPASLRYDVRSFAQKPAICEKANTTAMMMVRTLTSYPTMMVSETSLPPFIHPYSFEVAKLAEPSSADALGTCLSLMQILRNNTPGGRKLLWKNVRLECERMHADWASFEEWELLSSMQALLIYMLLRLGEGETVHNDCDISLLSAMWVVTCSLNAKIGNLLCSLPYGLTYGTTYKDWVFEESRRRLCVVFRLICMLFTTEPTSACILLDGYLIAPLPAKKQLWEARNEHEWSAENANVTGSSKTFGIKIDGRLVNLDMDQMLLDSDDSSTNLGNEDDNEANWREWCAGMDALGSLAMLATSMST